MSNNQLKGTLWKKSHFEDKSHRQGSYLPREFIAVKDSHVPAYCNAETFRNGFRDNLSDYIIFRRRSTGGDFSVPQTYTHSERYRIFRLSV